MNYDPKILEVKVKRRIRLYAKISFCLTFIVLSITFIIFIIAMFGKLKIRKLGFLFKLLHVEMNKRISLFITIVNLWTS